MNLRQRETEAVWGFLRAHEAALQPLASAILHGRVANVTAAAGNAYLTYRTGFPAGGELADAVAAGCAQAVGAWFAARPDSELAARRYAIALDDPREKFAFAQLVKERFDDAWASVEVTLAQRKVIDAPLHERLCIRHPDLQRTLQACLARYNDVQLRTALLPPVAQRSYLARMEEQRRIKEQLRERANKERRRPRRDVLVGVPMPSL